MKRIIWLVAIVSSVVVGLSLYLTQQDKKEENHPHFHAGFVVYVDGVRQDYSGAQYMHIDMCSIEEKQDSRTMQKEDRAHLHNNIGDVAHIHAEGVTWGELFENTGITLPVEKNVTVYRNGVKISSSIFEAHIAPYESILLSYGEDMVPKTSDFVTRKRIEEVEKIPSECGN